jgi:hypothetical protein
MVYSTRDYDKERFKKESRDNTFAVIFFAVILLLILAFYLIKCHMEARTYSRLTGNSVSTWDAIWVDLRVQDEPQ